MLKVSIIMPVYNSEKYLSVAIESVLRQTYKNFELILVDDGSADNSGQICDQYAKEYDCIKVFHKKNGGICDARNYGMKYATGDYIGFIDNDDEYEPDLLEDNIKLAEKYKADIVRFERRKVNYDPKGNRSVEKRAGLIPLMNEGNDYVAFNSKKVFQHYLEIKRGGGLSNVWNGLYKKSFLIEHKITFNTNYKFGCEDIHFNVQSYWKADKIVFNKNEYYIYNWRQNISTSTMYREDRLYNIEETSLMELNMLDEKNVSSLQKSLITIDYVYQFCQEFNFPSCSMDRKEKTKFFNQLYDKYKHNLSWGNLIQVGRFRIKDMAFALLFKCKLFQFMLDIQKKYESR